MKVVIKNANKVLYEQIRQAWTDNDAQRCLHLKLSSIEEDTDTWFPVLVREVTKFFDGNAGQIYLSHDKDVFILTRQITHKDLSKLLTHLIPKLSPALSPKGLATLYEISVDWPRLRDVCERKIECMERQKLGAIKFEEKKRDARYRQILDSIDIRNDLSETLSDRREERKYPLVMAVEDDMFSLHLVKNTIKKQYNIITAEDGREAVTMYAKYAPDILFLDIGLPDITGHDVLAKIYELDCNPYIVMLSGNGDRQNVLKAMANGASGFVVKPFTQEKLFQYIEKSPYIQQKNNKEGSHESTAT